MSLSKIQRMAQTRAQAEIERRRREGTWEGDLNALVEYQEDPIGFAVNEMGLRRETLVWSENPGYEGHEWDGTPDPIKAMVEALADGKDCGAESATGTGKSHTMGWATLWFLGSWHGARAFSYASKEEQLDLYSWTEIKKLWPRFEAIFPAALLTSLRIRMTGQDEEGGEAGWGAVGRSAGVGADEEIASKAAGMHAEHMLIFVEEAQGVPLPVSRAIENTATGQHNIRVYIGNPDHQHDTLHDFCKQPGVVHIRISALDHPNVVVNNHRVGEEDPKDPLSWSDVENDVEVVPGAVTRKSIRRRALRYGKGSRIYQTRVRGISPPESAEALIPRAWCESAAKRYNDPSLRDGLPALGVDVANSENGDKAAIAEGVGACLLSVPSKPCPDANQLGRDVATRMRANQPPIRTRNVGVDADGVGAGTVNELKRLRLRVQSLNSGTKAHRTTDPELLWEEDEDGEEHARRIVTEERFYNLRAQMWWQMRMDLQHGRIALPNDDELFDDLTTPEWETRNGVIIVEPKKSIRKRLDGRSTDKGDAAVYWNWVRPRQKIREEEEHRVDPNEDQFFEEHWERLNESHNPEYQAKSKRLKRNVGAVTRRGS